MIKKLKMTDISASEVKTELGFIRYSQMISPNIYETENETVLECEVNDTNKPIFAAVFQALSEYVYTDEDETPFKRFSDLVNIRKLKVGVIDQGFRGKLTQTLVQNGCPIIMSVYFGDERQMEEYFGTKSQTDIVTAFSRELCLDVVILGTAEFESDGLVSSLGKIMVCSQGLTDGKAYYLFGSPDDISDKLCFLATAFADRKIY